MSVISLHAFAHVLEPWQSLYCNSKSVATTVTTVHILALLFGRRRQ